MPFQFPVAVQTRRAGIARKKAPGDGTIGVDGDSGRPRGLIHQQITLLVSKFLVQSSGYKEVCPGAAPAR